MHHKNHRYSTANHNNPQHEKPHYPTGPAPGGSSTPKRGIFNRISEKFREKPATVEEVRQLRLEAQRETYKTQKAVAKSKRPSRFGGLVSEGRQPSYRRSSRYHVDENPLFGNSGGGFGFGGGGEGPSLDMFKDIPTKQSRRSKNESSSFGKGLSDLFT